MPQTGEEPDHEDESRWFRCFVFFFALSIRIYRSLSYKTSDRLPWEIGGVQESLISYIELGMLDFRLGVQAFVRSYRADQFRSWRSGVHADAGHFAKVPR